MNTTWAALRDRVSIVGLATTDYSALYKTPDPTRTEYDLALSVLSAAVRDAGISRHHIDGLITSRIPSYAMLGELAGLRNLSFANALEPGGRQSGLALQYASLVVSAGLARYVALIYANNGRSVRIRYGGGDESASAPEHAVYGMTSPGAYMAMMFNRHRALYGTSNEALLEVAQVNRGAAQGNPAAIMRQPLQSEDYWNSRFVVEPLRLYDYCLINDGAVCLIVTSTERARDLRNKPVRIRASVAAAELDSCYASRDCFYETGRRLSKIYELAGIDRNDINALMVYENFTPLCIFTLEALGFCGQGEGGEWIREGHLRPRDRFGYNTSGGHLSEGYMQGWSLIAEAVRQLRSEASASNQIKQCVAAQYTCLTSLATSHILTA